ncbi:hypothetical protein FOYG_08934 [Fusarium oxysporum NRRL 32931]|uniref:Cupin 2 conserved barrel domain-containing protein n=1 Tax=Fusarium oxysporum NRRL 32931 TaxID=660029 RepID=W9IAU2_FUSOX|nr:hypothetical protein FOYG_08934 [Fusarium oxysporum NRRL 32931]
MTSPLPPLRRIVTGHNDAGPATVKYDDKATAKIVPRDAALRSLWITDSSPADLSSPGDNADAEVGIINNGSIFRIVDFPPRSSGHMHRMISIDYVIVQKGAVVLALDDKSKTLQGTMHGWDNPTDEWARLLVILLPTKAPVVAGKALQSDVSSLGV